MKKKIKSINSHVIAQTYLKEFSSHKDKIWQYDIVESKDKEISYIKAGAIKNYFAFRDKAKKIHTTEHLFADIAENDYKVVIEKIRKNVEPTQPDIDALKAFLTLQILRPKKLRELWEKSSIKFIILSFQEELKQSPRIISDLYTNLIEAGQFDGSEQDLIKEVLNLDSSAVKMYKNYKSYFGTITLLELYKSVYLHISTLKPRFLYNRSACKLITSDHPYFIYSQNDSDELSLGLNGDVVYLPLASNLLTVLSSNPVRNILKADQVNQQIVNAADRFIFHDGNKSVEGYVKRRKPTMLYKVEEVNDDNKRKGLKISRKRI